MKMEKLRRNFIVNKILLMIFIHANKWGVLANVENYNAGRHDSAVMCSIAAWATAYNDWDIIHESRINPFLCTHLIYSFAGIEPTSSRIKSLDHERDLSVEDGGKNGGFKKITNLKTKFPHLKIMIAIGGWHEGSVKFSAMAASPEKRKSFAESVAQFIREYNFDGVDITWMYPTTRNGKAEDKFNFVQLLKELKSVLVKNDWLLTASLSKSPYIIHKAYDIPEISNIVDYMNIMSYGYHGPWENKTGHSSPLYQRHDEYDKEENVDTTIKLFLELGASRKKINLGISFSGYNFTLASPSNTSVGVKTISRSDDDVTYDKICQSDFINWTTKWDNVQHVVYAFSGSKWLTYEDEHSIHDKVEYAVNNRLAGIFVYQVQMDDVHGKCKKKAMPLLREVNKVLVQGFERLSALSPHRLPNNVAPNQCQCTCNGACAHHSNVNWIIFIILLPFFILLKTT